MAGVLSAVYSEFHPVLESLTITVKQSYTSIWILPVP